MLPLYLSNSSSVPSSYGVQNAMASFQYSGFAGVAYDNPYGSDLNWEGCIINGTALRNCTAACQDPSLVFASTSTLQNCMVLSTLSILEPITYPTPDTLNILDGYSIDVANTDFNLFDNTIQKCFLAYCRANSNCGIPHFDDINANAHDEIAYDYPFDNYFTCAFSTADSCFTDVCNNITSALNLDVGGIGVCSLSLAFMTFAKSLPRYTSPI